MSTKTPTQTSPSTAPGRYLEIPISDVFESPMNVRKHFDQAALEELANSIRQHGIQQPIVVRPDRAPDECFEVVCGARRLRAGRLAGVETVPAIVRALSDAEALEIMILENNQRSDVHPLEEAAGFAALLETKLYGERREAVKELAEKVGRSERYVYDSLKLHNSLDPDVCKAFLAGDVDKTSAIMLSRLTHEQQIKAMRFLTRTEWSIEEEWKIAEIREHSRSFAAWIAQNITLNLSAAPWQWNDAGLLPQAGPCSTCPKNSKNDGLPLPDAEGAASGLCTDRECYQAKLQAFERRRVAEVAAETGQEPILLIAPYSERRPGAVSTHDVVVVPAGTPGAVPAVYTTPDYGRAKIGEQVYIMPVTPGGKSVKSPEQIEKARRVKIERELRMELVTRIASSTVSFHLDLMRYYLSDKLTRCGNQTLERVGKILGLEIERTNSWSHYLRGRVNSADHTQIGKIAAALRWAENLEVHWDSPCEELEKAAAAAKIRVSEIRMEIASRNAPKDVQAPAKPAKGKKAPPIVEAIERLSMAPAQTEGARDILLDGWDGPAKPETAVVADPVIETPVAPVEPETVGVIETTPESDVSINETPAEPITTEPVVKQNATETIITEPVIEQEAESVKQEEAKGEPVLGLVICKEDETTPFEEVNAETLSACADVLSINGLMSTKPHVLGLVLYEGRYWIVVDVADDGSVKMVPSVPRAEFTGVVRKAGEAGVVGQCFLWRGNEYVSGQLKDRIILRVAE